MRILCNSRQTGIFTIAVNISEHRLDYCLFFPAGETEGNAKPDPFD